MYQPEIAGVGQRVEIADCGDRDWYPERGQAARFARTLLDVAEADAEDDARWPESLESVAVAGGATAADQADRGPR